jgi:hypothetical protein
MLRIGASKASMLSRGLSRCNRQLLRRYVAFGVLVCLP